jgi:hypothetical protein
MGMNEVKAFHMVSGNIRLLCIVCPHRPTSCTAVVTTASLASYATFLKWVTLTDKAWSSQGQKVGFQCTPRNSCREQIKIKPFQVAIYVYHHIA